MTVLDEFTTRAMIARPQAIEQHIRILLRPKPRWLPEWIWMRLVARILIVEYRR